jgi:hypothetical protein
VLRYAGQTRTSRTLIATANAEANMRHLLIALALTLPAGCAGPLPDVDPQLAWVDMRTTSGTLIMADKLDGVTTDDGRYFQVTPGSHRLQIRYDYEVRYGGFSALTDDYTELTCYIDLRYDHFQAGQRYLIEGRSLANDVGARLLDAQRNVLANQDSVSCI